MEKNIEILIVKTDEDYENMKSVRRKVFVEEQGIPENLEFDGNDHLATHILLLDDGVPAGTMRIRYFANFVKFERMAVIKSKRGQGEVNFADLIMKRGIEFVRRKGYRRIYGVCKKELLSRWQKCGYQQVKNAPLLEQNGMTLIPIMSVLKKHDKAIKITDNPAILTGIEDTWDEIKVDKAKPKKEQNSSKEGLGNSNKIMALFVNMKNNLRKK